MGPAYFVIAILGCADGGSSCTPVATLPARYASAYECSAATTRALERNNNFDFPELLARCEGSVAPAAADARRKQSTPERDRRG
jgi:hypothetical protein